MLRQKKDSWDESFEHENNRSVHYQQEIDIYLEPEPGTYDEFEGLDDVLDPETAVGEYIDEAHEALNRLYQKTNKRGKLMRQPKRADSWQ